MWVLGNVCALFVIPGSSWWLVNTWCRGGHRLWASRLESSTVVSCDRGRAIRFVVADVVCTQGKATRFIPSLLTDRRPHIKMNGLLNIPVVRAQFKYCMYTNTVLNPGCPASSDVGNAISTKTKTKSRLREIWSWNPPKMIQSCQRICSYTTLSKIHGFWRTEQSWTLLRTHLCLLTLVALQSDVA